MTFIRSHSLLIRSLFTMLVFAWASQAQAQPTIMDLINQVKANNDALSTRVVNIEQVQQAQGSQLNAMQDKINKIHAALVTGQPQGPTSSVTVVKPQAPAQAWAPQTQAQMPQASDCANGSCGTGMARSRRQSMNSYSAGGNITVGRQPILPWRR